MRIDPISYTDEDFPDQQRNLLKAAIKAEGEQVDQVEYVAGSTDSYGGNRHFIVRAKSGNIYHADIRHSNGKLYANEVIKLFANGS